MAKLHDYSKIPYHLNGEEKQSTSGMFWMLVDANWTPIIQFFIGISCLLNAHDKLFNVSKTTIQ